MATYVTRSLVLDMQSQKARFVDINGNSVELDADGIVFDEDIDVTSMEIVADNMEASLSFTEPVEVVPTSETAQYEEEYSEQYNVLHVRKYTGSTTTASLVPAGLPVIAWYPGYFIRKLLGIPAVEKYTGVTEVDYRIKDRIVRVYYSKGRKEIENVDSVKVEQRRVKSLTTIGVVSEIYLPEDSVATYSPVTRTLEIIG